MQAVVSLTSILSKMSIFNNAVHFIRSRRYEFLLLSFLVLIFGNTFVTHSHLIGIIDIYQNLFIGLIIFYEKKWIRIILISIILLSISLDSLDAIIHLPELRKRLGLAYLCFFFLVAKEVFKEVLYIKTVSRELLSAALCGFVLLCMIATFLFYIIEMEVPGSFSNVGTGGDRLTNLNYFSFTTLLTIGFGDIVPLSLITKRAVMLMGLAGHFYTVFVTSIIIGKYLSAKKQGGEQ